MIVDASGAHSVIRDRFGDIRFRKPFSYGALWGICEDKGEFPKNILQQRFHKATAGIGVIPIGRKPGEDKDHLAVHWSMRHKDYEAWRNSPLDCWKKQVTDVYPEAASLVSQFKSHDDLTMADYREIALNKFYAGKIAFIGDACHSISPRLGQGANLGLVDALVLSRSLAKFPGIEHALENYDALRKKHVRFYHRASRWMNFLFQSDTTAAAVVRDAGFRVMNRLPYTHRRMLMTMSGLQTGFVGSLDPADLHDSYAFLK